MFTWQRLPIADPFGNRLERRQSVAPGARACCSNEIKLALARSRGLYARVQVPPEEFF